MTLAIVIIAAVTSVLVAALLAAGISSRPTTPCLFDHTTVMTNESRFEAGPCVGKPENVYVSGHPATQRLDGAKACNAHVGYLLDVAQTLIREHT